MTEALSDKRIEDAYRDALWSYNYLRTMRDSRAEIYETIIELLREEINNRAEHARDIPSDGFRGYMS